MTPTEFLETVKKNHRTEYKYFNSTTISEVLVHASLGTSTEAGELEDVIKKAMIYGKTPDLVNVKEELGDMLWYIGLACIDLGCTFEELFDQNWAKLQVRYEQGKFSEDSALNRDLDAERQALEAPTQVEQSNTTQTQDVVSPRVGGAITRAFIRLNESSPKAGQEYIDPVSQDHYKYDGVQWLKVKKDA